MRIGYNTWSMAKVPYTAFIPGLSDIGFGAIAISVVPGYTIGGQWVENAAALDRLSADDRRQIKQAFVERDLKLPSVIGNQSLVEDDAAKNALAMRRLRDSIDLCVELAIDGHVPTMNTGVAGHSGDLEAKSGVVLDRLGALAEHARQRGVVICIEPHVGGAVDTVERAESLIRTVDSPAVRLDFDVSHFEVVGVPMQTSVPRLLPLANAVEIKDQHFRYLDAGGDDPQRGPLRGKLAGTGSAADGWLVEGNGVGRATAPNGRPVEFQFLLAGEGTFDLSGYLKLVKAHGFAEPIAFEASVQCQARPGYDALASAASIYRWMADGWQRAGLSTD
jgi:sugar phosphate isomerase/epimerase